MTQKSECSTVISFKNLKYFINLGRVFHIRKQAYFLSWDAGSVPFLAEYFSSTGTLPVT
jgi:hypothetical protein